MESDNKTSEDATTHSSLGTAVVLLEKRLFSCCRSLIDRRPRSDPEIAAQLDRMLAIVNVLDAASLRLGPTKTLTDHYSILQLNSSDAANRDLVRQRFKTLVRLLDPNKNKFPFVDEALMRVREAWHVLSDPVRLDRYERAIHAKNVAFWTMCPYCWYLHEYEIKYQDCTLRCGNCQRTFHGTAVKPPEPESMVEGKEQYYCYHMSLPLRYPVDEKCSFELGGNGGKRMRIKTVANRVRVKGFVASDDDDSDLEMEI